MKLKNSHIILITSFFLISCNKTSELRSVCKNEKLNSVINEFIVKINMDENSNAENAIQIYGSKKNDSIFEISVYNDRPTIYTDKYSLFLNKELEKSELGYFKYKDFDFFVTSELKQLFKLDYENEKNFDSKFNKEKAPFPKDYPVMWIKLNIKSNKISYTMPFSGIDWTEK